MIKKILLLSLFSFILFFTSCASSAASEEENKSEPTVEQSSEQSEQQNPLESSKDDENKEENLFELSPSATNESENIEESENSSSETEQNSENETSIVLDDENNENFFLENSEENQSENPLFDTLEKPEDFEEPLVRDLDSSFLDDEEIEQNQNIESEEEKPFEEPVDFSDIYPDDNFVSSDYENELNEFSDEDAISDETNESDDLNDFSETSESDFFEESDDLLFENESTEEEIVIIPSRSVSLRKGENLAIVYPGSGWIYMGSLSEYSNMASKGRKLGSQDTKYTLLAKEAGTQIHHFYKVDNLTGEYIDDYIEITVLDQKGSSKTTITAPEYIEFVPPKPETPAKATIPQEIQTENNESEIIADSIESDKSEKTKTIDSEITKTENNQKDSKENKFTKKEKKSYDEKQSYINIPENQSESNTEIKADNQIENTTINFSDNSDNVPSEDDLNLISVDDEVCIDIEEDESFANQVHINTDELLDKAQNAFIERNFEESYNYLSEFFEYAIDRQDEALFLQGQLLETDSKIKDIKGSIQAYELLIKNYPASSYWNDANKRIKYLKKFYYFSN